MINEKIQQMYELAGSQKGQLAQELLDFAGSIPTYGKQVGDNTKLLTKCLELNQTLIGNIKSMVSKGLRFANGDYYIFLQKGGKLTVSMSPSGRAKAVDFLLKDKGVRVTLNIGTVKDGDIVSFKTKGSIQTIEVESNQQAIFTRNANVIGCYGVVSIFSEKTDALMAQNVILVDTIEYQAIKNMASKTMTTYESMFINKVILRRYASLLPAFIGGGFTDDELDTLGDIREQSRVDKGEPTQEAKKVSENIEAKDKITNIYKSTLDANRKPTKISKSISNLIGQAKEGKKDNQGKPIVNIELLPLEVLQKLLNDIETLMQDKQNG